jgi:protein-tyrosine kinase
VEQQQPMDHISKALERAQGEQRSSVRAWMRASGTDRPLEVLELTPARCATLDDAHLHERHILCGRGKEDPAVSDRYRLLRTRVIQALRVQGKHAFGVTSPGPQDGKSLTSINLAISIAREGSHSVLLVDADLRKPSIAADLGISVDRGLIDFLSTDIGFSDVLIGTSIDNLFVLPGRQSDSAAAPELLSSPKLRSLVEQLQGRERCIVVVDLPPVGLGDDVVALAPYLDGLLLVVREGGTSIDALKQSVESLKDFTILGTVLNRSSERKLKFEGYYYQGAPERV